MLDIEAKKSSYCMKANLFFSLILCVFLLSCNSSTNKQFQEAQQCYENKEYEEAIRLLEIIDKDSPHYAEAQLLIKQSYRELVNGLMEEYRYDEAIALIDTISPRSCYYGISRLLIPSIRISKIEYIIRNSDVKVLSDNTFEPFDNSVRQLQYMYDTISTDPDLLERKTAYERTLSLAYLLESEYYIEKHRYEDALILLNNVNPECIDTEKFTVDMYRREIISTINSINRKKDIEAIKTMTSSICEMNYFDKFHASDYKNDMLKEVGVFKEYWKVITDVKTAYKSDEEIMSLVMKLQNEVVRVQKREFPILRKQYAKILSKNLWIEDIDVYCGGSRNTVISFYGYWYATRENVSDTQNKESSYLKQLRFKKSIYYWCRGFDPTHSYNIDSPDDGDPVL